MSLEVSKVDVWVGEIEDVPGGAAGVLDALAAAGANLEFVIARRDGKKQGKGVIFIAPLKGAKQAGAARKAKLKKAKTMSPLRVAGPDKAGTGAAIMCKLAEAGINVRGLSAAKIGRKFVLYLSFDKPADSTQAARLLRKM